MGPVKKLQPTQAAERFIELKFPECQGALLSGSVVRGEATETSDLDVVVFDDGVKSSYRESFIEFGWRIEVFVHNSISYKSFFHSDCQRARPSMPRMVCEGFVLKGEAYLIPIKKEAENLLNQGPSPLSEEEIVMRRYFITDALDDLIGCTRRSEGIFIANTLSTLLSDFVLRMNGHWSGSSKWIMRALINYDKSYAETSIEAFECFYKKDDKTRIIRLVDNALEPYGGRLFEGFTLGKN